jgi:quercetin dioxygenase-like cupin family protein
VVEEARLEAVASGLAPVSPGWFVVNTRDAAWVNNDYFGGVCIFESDEFVLRGRPDLDEYVKPAAGFTIRVFLPGAAGHYHRESVQEDFLVLQGECILVIEGEERRLGPWDFVHCPPGVAHTFVGTGHGPCVIVGSGNRREDLERDYLECDAAIRHGATVASDTRSAGSSWRVERPSRWDDLPWSETREEG